MAADCSLGGKVVLITGASSGIGRATAVHFASLGARLAIAGRNASALAETASSCKAAGSPDVVTITGDLLVDADCERVVQEAVDYFKELNVLVNNAGGGWTPDSIMDLKMKQFDDIMAVNLRTTVNMMRLCVPHLIKTKGNIVNVSSVSALRVFAGTMVYASAKAALDHFSKCAALELAPKQVRVNCVNPGMIVTEAYLRAGITQEQLDALIEKAKSWHALGRTGTPQEIARAIAFLASDESSFITGILLPVEGGIMIKPAA